MEETRNYGVTETGVTKTGNDGTRNSVGNDMIVREVRIGSKGLERTEDGGPP